MMSVSESVSSLTWSGSAGVSVILVWLLRFLKSIPIRVPDGQLDAIGPLCESESVSLGVDGSLETRLGTSCSKSSLCSS